MEHPWEPQDNAVDAEQNTEYLCNDLAMLEMHE